MPKLAIDNQEVEIAAGATILDAARKLGIDIPTLCYLEGGEPATSCMVCVVKVAGADRLVPACATQAEDGMKVESETPEVHDARRSALELLLADHLGDCLAPCQVACPAGVNVPLMARQIAAGKLAEAARTVNRDLPLAAVLARICPAPCEKACRRNFADAPVSIRLLMRRVAEAGAALGHVSNEGRAATSRDRKGADIPGIDVGVSAPSQSRLVDTPPLDRRVAVVGAGPAGLSAAYCLLQAGCEVVVFDECEEPGGALRSSLDETLLPRAVLDAEIAAIRSLGARFRCGVRVGSDMPLDELRSDFDAVLLAVGELDDERASALGVRRGERGIEVDRDTHQTHLPGVFAAGGAVHPSRLAVRAVADAKSAVECILQYLSNGQAQGTPRAFSTHVGRLGEDEMEQFLAGAARYRRVEPAGGQAAGFTDDEARSEAGRCLHCDCRKADDCKLRTYAQRYGARPGRYRLERRSFRQDASHDEIIFEPGKCIDCGICVRLSAEAREELGLTFVGRGFDVRVRVPFGRSVADGLRKVAARCARACPTGALAFKDNP